ncbi:hypothetical protein PsYK624_121910 [Phanerochaete sordida]|uniref:Uncharacterized protein n=1 Tax=Phanerochaete sordida TaxID=48140 RepID=A0A9P3LIC7_9APHY|nr:hypothetical protein PsYK624_121910 [Phanerochaete sordida]
MQPSSVANWVDAVNQELHPERPPRHEPPSPERVSQELYPDPASSVTQEVEGSLRLATPVTAEIPSVPAITVDGGIDAPSSMRAPGNDGSPASRATHAVPNLFRLSVALAVGLASLLIPAVRNTVISTASSSVCTSPLRASFAFCRGPQDVVVMHDFAALAQIHSLTLATLYDTALGVWTLSEELAHQGRSAKQLAYYAEDSSLPVRDTIARDLHLLNENTKTAATSLNKLGATTVGTVMRTAASFERIYRTVHALNTRGARPDAADVAATLQHTFLRAARELTADLGALQNATWFTLGDLALLEAHVHALDAAARRSDRALESALDALERRAARRLLWARARAEAALDAALDDAALLGALRANCAAARKAVSASAGAVTQMLAEMEYLAGLPATRLLMDGVALPQLVGDLKAYSVGIEVMLARFEDARAQERAKRWAAVDARRVDHTRLQIDDTGP